MILNLQQAAETLDIHPVTLRKLAKKGKVPANKIGREWRFSTEALERHVSGMDNGLGHKQEEPPREATTWQRSTKEKARTTGKSSTPTQTEKEYNALLAL